MTVHTLITAEQANASYKRERELHKVREDLELDQRIAERAGNADEVARLKKAQSAALREWADAWRAAEADVKMALQSAGFDIAAVKQGVR